MSRSTLRSADRHRIWHESHGQQAHETDSEQWAVAPLRHFEYTFTAYELSSHAMEGVLAGADGPARRAVIKATVHWNSSVQKITSKPPRAIEWE
ncbi:MAG: hypothetical protein WCR23_12240 [Planctomycetota bacterium]|nr:MAG: hypothetical protein DWH80_08215 [Planctomycetota bacterium]